MGLLMLAPDIQESILMLPKVHEGRDTVTERDLRRITRSLDWGVQRRLWTKLDQSRMVPKTDCQWLRMKISFMISRELYTASFRTRFIPYRFIRTDF